LAYQKEQGFCLGASFLILPFTFLLDPWASHNWDPLFFQEASADYGMKSSGKILRGSSPAWMEEVMIQ